MSICRAPICIPLWKLAQPKAHNKLYKLLSTPQREYMLEIFVLLGTLQIYNCAFGWQTLISSVSLSFSKITIHYIYALLINT